MIEGGTDIRIDMASDTLTRPTPCMRQAMIEAPVGDEQRGEDPTTNELCARVATLLGKEASVFLPSGTMCNQIAILVHCVPGDEVLADEVSHIIGSEGAGAAALAGVAIRALRGRNGIFSPAQLTAAIRPGKCNAPRSRLVVTEQTANFGGGAVWSLPALQAVADVARSHGLALHMDGARLLNAAVASAVAARCMAAPFDSVWLDLSKGLGCPVGAVLAGSNDFIEQAWRWKQRLGGAMRQSGMLAAAGIYALQHHVERLVDDHTNARLFARLITGIEGIRLEHAEIETNLVFFDVEHTGLAATEVAQRLRARGIRIGCEGAYRMRAVTHLDVDRAGVEQAAAALAATVA